MSMVVLRFGTTVSGSGYPLLRSVLRAASVALKPAERMDQRGWMSPWYHRATVHTAVALTIKYPP